MRRLVFVVFAVLAAASVVSFSTLSAHAQSADQYGSAGGSEDTQDTSETTDAPEKTAPEETSSGASRIVEGSVSQGSIGDPGSSEAIAAREDLTEEESLPDYSQVVDNATKGAFKAPGWKKQRGSLSHDGTYVAAGKSKAPASFTVKIPSSSDYSVYAWWPDASTAARYGVETATGTSWSEVDQGSDTSGMWVKVGTYAMEEGERTVQIARGGKVVADAIAVVRGETAAPPEDETMAASGGRSTATDGRALSRFSGKDVVRQARRHLGDRYDWGTCTRTVKSCTCLTKMAVKPFGHKMGMTEKGQWKYSRSKQVPKSRLKPGDEVFFKEGRSQEITHVGIYSGNGRIVHASAYFGKVVEKEMKYVDGYFGAKRFKSR